MTIFLNFKCVDIFILKTYLDIYEHLNIFIEIRPWEKEGWLPFSSPSHPLVLAPKTSSIYITCLIVWIAYI